MVTDIWKNPDNLLSGYIRISKYPFNYPSKWLLIFFLYCFVQFYKIFMLVTRILYINTSISKILATILVTGHEPATIVIFPRLYAIRPSRSHYQFMILFDFHAASVKSFNWKQPHIGIQLFIRIIQYPINRYPDSNNNNNTQTISNTP